MNYKYPEYCPKCVFQDDLEADMCSLCEKAYFLSEEGMTFEEEPALYFERKE